MAARKLPPPGAFRALMEQSPNASPNLRTLAAGQFFQEAGILPGDTDPAVLNEVMEALAYHQGYTFPTVDFTTLPGGYLSTTAPAFIYSSIRPDTQETHSLFIYKDRLYALDSIHGPETYDSEPVYPVNLTPIWMEPTQAQSYSYVEKKMPDNSHLFLGQAWGEQNFTGPYSHDPKPGVTRLYLWGKPATGEGLRSHWTTTELWQDDNLKDYYVISLRHPDGRDQDNEHGKWIPVELFLTPISADLIWEPIN